MKNILFYGASVSAQSGKSGYFDNLESSEYDFMRMTFPSSQFYNAGFYNVMNIGKLAKKPDIVFFEWSTTGENEFDLVRLKYVLQELISNGLFIVFLILPKKDTYSNNRKCDDQLYKISADSNIPLLDLRYVLQENNIDEVLRDNVHTSDFGAKLYANAILEYLNSKPKSDCKNIIVDKVPNFKIMQYDLDIILHENQFLIFNYSSNLENSEIAMSHIKGPYSPIIEYIDNDELIAKHNFFDPWCYYERENFDTLVGEAVINKSKNKSIRLKISSDTPDYSITKTQEVFNIPKILNIKSVYTAGISELSYSII